ncbi:MAG TPA: phenylalanine--tRNA ligase subunit alpha [Acidobacteriota bacterium]|nr:phenylalanine--tRNA ligase subunit alpha [Acidobacteriota bacterium]
MPAGPLDDVAGAADDPVALVETIVEQFERDSVEVRDLEALEELQARYLGRKRGRLTAVFQSMRNLDADAKRRVGGAANRARQAIGRALEDLEERLRGAAAAERDQSEAIDVTQPAVPDALGGLHPITRTLAEIESIFVAMGYEVVDGPEIETDWYNFGALNFPPDHPARDAQDTLHLDGGLLLRTHTSPVQIRYMEAHEPPFAIIVPGRVFRRDTPDATHTPMFVQLEGLVVDTDITMADLKGTLDAFAKALFGDQTATRFRPGYFPFTEPSAELDATCPACGGSGCRVCKGSGWVELLGSGMVHPALFENVGYEAGRYQGFAFGFGIDRITAVRYGVEDIRYYYENDLRFLRQFAS